MFHSKPFKKDITPFAKGGKVVKHVGKGAREQTRGYGGSESLTGADSLARMSNNYAKPQPQPEAAPAASQPAPPVPTGPRGGSAPSAMMPPDMGGDEEE